jgi:hypothetical protein
LSVGFGGLGLLLAVGILGGSLAIGSLMGLGGDEALLPMHIVALAGGLIAFFTLVIAGLSLAVGIGLLERKHWARTLGLIFAALSLFHLPFGTALGLYAFWVLLKPETEALFHSH